MPGISEAHVRYLENRKLNIEVAVKLGLESAGPAIAIPYIRDGAKLYSKNRDPRDKARTRCVPAGVDQTSLWNEDCLTDEPSPNDCLVITEGEFDALAVLQSGFQYVVSLPSGASKSRDGCLSKAERCLAIDVNGKLALKPKLARFRKVVVATDCDHDGLMMRDAIVSLLGDDVCWLPEYPAACKDANDVLVYGGESAVLALINGARAARDDGFRPLTNFDEAPRKVHEYGIPFLWQHLRITKPEFFVIGGTAGAGKSTVAQRIVFGLCYHNKMRASMFCAEDNASTILRRARRFWSCQNEGLGSSEAVHAERDAWVSDHLALIRPPQDVEPTFEWMLWAMERQALDRHRDIFLLDPWNEITHERSKGMSVTDYTGEAIIKMKRLATRHNLILIVAHHARKPDDPKRLPNMYDLADSAHWANKADHVLIAHPAAENKVCLAVVKSKDHTLMGRPGRVHASLIDQVGVFDLNQVLADQPDLVA